MMRNMYGIRVVVRIVFPGLSAPADELHRVAVLGLRQAEGLQFTSQG